MPIPRFLNDYDGNKVMCWFNGPMMALVFVVKTLHLLLNPHSDDNSAEDLRFEKIFLSWLQLEESQVVDPNEAAEAFNHQFLNSTLDLRQMNLIDLTFYGLMPQYQEDYRGSKMFSFMQPTTKLLKITDACTKCRRLEIRTFSRETVLNSIFNVELSQEDNGLSFQELVEHSFNFSNVYETECDGRRCNQLRRNTQRLLLQDTKDVLVCKIGRVYHTGNGETFRRHKIERRVQLGGTLQLPTFTGATVMYDLLATVQHIGSCYSGILNLSKL